MQQISQMIRVISIIRGKVGSTSWFTKLPPSMAVVALFGLFVIQVVVIKAASSLYRRY